MTGVAMHPMLKPALRRGWRSRDTVQFGVSRAHAVVLGPVDTATGSFLELLDGTRGMPLLRREARAMGLPEGRADALVDRLAGAGLLDDPVEGAERAAAAWGRGAALDRLRPDLAALSVLSPEPGAAARLLAARGAMRVQVRGAGRVGAAVAALLSASGVGQVDVVDGGRVEPWDVMPGGLPAERIGERREAAARGLVRRSAPGPRPRRPAAGAVGSVSAPAGSGAGAAGSAGSVSGFAGSDSWSAGCVSGSAGSAGCVSGSAGEPGLTLVVIAPRDGLAAYAPDPEEAEPLLASGTPHLYAGVLEATGVLGPLVLPGITPCAGCAAARRAEREPAWPRMLAQWRSGRRRAGWACDTALATVVAGVTAAHALGYLGGRLPPSAGARLEAALPSLTWETRRIEPHPECRCGAAGRTDAVYASVAEAQHATMAR